MKVELSTKIDLPAEQVWEAVQTQELLVHVAWPLVRFTPIEPKSVSGFVSGGRYLVGLQLFGVLPFGAQWIVTTDETELGKAWPKLLRDNGYSAIIKTWDHWISIEPDGTKITRYSDQVEIKAGILTPFIWLFAHTFYRHRQRRWRGLAKTLNIRKAIKAEMSLYAEAHARGEIAEAWHRLERAHILSQRFLSLHLSNHIEMLRYAIYLLDRREIVGQLIRLVLAPIGALANHIPAGNTGRSNVSAFESMPIPEDLEAAMKEHQP
jgi:ligand-binding SRPBCC domain-containing protein